MFESRKRPEIGHHTVNGSWKSFGIESLKSIVVGFHYCLTAANAYARPFCRKRNKITRSNYRSKGGNSMYLNSNAFSIRLSRTGNTIRHGERVVTITYYQDPKSEDLELLHPIIFNYVTFMQSVI